ncbi:MAG: sulfurtransferase complex subunit TusC [Gammaproteobacteria bacterium]
MNDQKRCLFINRKSPYESAHAQEALDMAYALSAFEHKVSLVFMDEGVLQILRDQDSTEIGIKNFSPAFRAWQDYEIDQLYVDEESLKKRAIKTSDLIVEVELINTDQLGKIINQQEFIFND